MRQKASRHAGGLNRATTCGIYLVSDEGTNPMQGENAERWRKLCEQAALEQDPQKLLKLIGEINRLLSEKENRLMRQQGDAKQQTSSSP